MMKKHLNYTKPCSRLRSSANTLFDQLPFTIKALCALLCSMVLFPCTSVIPADESATSENTASTSVDDSNSQAPVRHTETV